MSRSKLHNWVCFVVLFTLVITGCTKKNSNNVQLKIDGKNLKSNPDQVMVVGKIDLTEEHRNKLPSPPKKLNLIVVLKNKKGEAVNITTVKLRRLPFIYRLKKKHLRIPIQPKDSLSLYARVVRDKDKHKLPKKGQLIGNVSFEFTPINDKPIFNKSQKYAENLKTDVVVGLAPRPY